jgi:hypothetical protein
MATGWPMKTTYADGDVYSASDVNDITGTVNLLQTSTLSYQSGKNAVINGGFDIWQRGTSSTNMVAGYYTADRWKTVRSGNVAGYTVSRQTTFQAGTSYAIRLQRTAANNTTDSMFLAYAVETLDWTRYQGKTLTFSFYAKGGANYSPTSSILGVNLYTGTGTDQDPLAALTGEVQQIGQNAVITTTATRYTYTFTCPSNSTDMRFNFSIAPTGTAGAADFVEITGVQIELGSYATTFSRTGGSIQGELAACQRYYYRSTGAGDQNRIATLGGNPTSSIFDCNVAVPSTFRGTVSAIDVANIGVYINNNNTVYSGGTWTVLTGIATAPTVRYTHTSGAMTQGHNGFIVQNGATAGYFGLSAEL